MDKTINRPEAISVYGIVRDRDQAERAISILREQRFSSEEISLLAGPSGASELPSLSDDSMATAAAMVGTGTGAVIGGAVGWIAGVGAVALPGIGTLLAMGPIATILAGAVAGSVTVGIAATLVGSGLPRHEAAHYEGLLKEGNILIAVHADNQERMEKARAILEDVGATEIMFDQDLREMEKAESRDAGHY